MNTRQKHLLSTMVSVTLALLAYLLVLAISNDNQKSFDLTSDQRHSFSQQTLDLVGNLDFQVKVYAFADPAGGSNQKSSTASGKSRKGSTAPSSNAKSHSTSASSSGGAKADHSQGNAGTSGTWNQKQPNSTADQNTGGANGQCADRRGRHPSSARNAASPVRAPPSPLSACSPRNRACPFPTP